MTCTHFLGRMGLPHGMRGTDGAIWSVWERVMAIFSVLATLSLPAPAQGELGAVHIEGATTLTGYNPDGSVSLRQEAKAFSGCIAGCLWAVRLIENTNYPNAITDVSCDGTNIYVFVGDAGGRTLIGGASTPFEQSGSVYPGCIKVFPMRMGPIWWAYCSSCVLNRDGPVVDFMGLISHGNQAPAMVSLKLEETSGTARRIGPARASISPTKAPATWDDLAGPLASVQPSGVSEVEGVPVVTNSTVLVDHPPSAGGGPPRLQFAYSIRLMHWWRETNHVPFVPLITKPALIQDHRSPNAGEYVATRWLTPDERKGARASPIADSADARRGALWHSGVVRGILLLLVLLPPAGIGIARLIRSYRVRLKTK